VEIAAGIFFVAFGAIFGLMSVGTHQERSRPAFSRPAHQAIEFFSLGRNEGLGVVGAGVSGALFFLFGIACLTGLIDLPPRAP